jgi:hypothetical protein
MRRIMPIHPTLSEDTAMAKSDLFVGAGKFTGGTISGLFRQRAGEDRWETITKGLPEPASIQALTVLPSNRDVMFAGTQHGVYRSRTSRPASRCGRSPCTRRIRA